MATEVSSPSFVKTYGEANLAALFTFVSSARDAEGIASCITKDIQTIFLGKK